MQPTTEMHSHAAVKPTWPPFLGGLLLIRYPLAASMLAMALTALLTAGALSAETQPPNIVFVLVDDLGWSDVGCYDPLERGFYETPHIDRLAEQGVRFTQAYTNGANCAPTRAALMSGQYYPNQPIYHVGSPSQGKMLPATNAHSLPLDKITIPEALRAAGYTSAHLGKWHLGDPPDKGPVQQGFDLNIGGYSAGNPNAWPGQYFEPNNNPFIDDAEPGEYLTDYLTRKAVEFIETHREGPFFLYLSYYSPHTPLQAPPERVRKYRQKQGRGGHDHPVYAAMIESLDMGVGQLLAAVDRLGIADNTIFIFYSDNGGDGSYRDLGRPHNGITDNSPLKSGKGSFYEGGIRVPLIIRWPAVIEPNTTSEAVVTSIDFYPTFLEAAGLQPPDDYLLDGLSMLPLFHDPAASLDREAIYWHFPGYPNVAWRTSPVSVIRSGDWKLKKFYEDDRLELYHLENDIGEQHNLADRHPEQRRHLQQMLEDWLTEHSAPLPRHRDR